MSTQLWTKVTTLSFKTKAILLAIALGVVPIAAIGTLNYLQIQRASQQKVAVDQQNRAAAIADKLNRFIFERNGMLQS